MTRVMTREERKKAYMKQAEQLFEEMEGWYDKNPEATFEEIEGEARKSRRKLMGESMTIFVNGRDTGKLKANPLCPTCQKEMVYKGHSQKRVYGVEGDSTLNRAYYHCPQKCGGGVFFPIG